MAAGDYRIGLDGKFLYGTAGSTATTEADNVQDVSLGVSARTAEAIRRGKTWVATKPTILEGTVEFGMLDIEGDSFLADIKSAFFGKTKIALYPKDAATGEGLDADYYIVDFKRDEANEEFISYNVTAKPTDETRDPSWT